MSDNANTAAAPVRVAAAVLQRQHGQQFLLARRPPGKVYAGYWEFPGGKVEEGESYHHALVRELQEELGITVTQAHPWLWRQFTYPHATVRICFFRVTAWEGELAEDANSPTIEHDAIAWLDAWPGPESVAVEPVLPANGPILAALALPTTYAITDAASRGVAAELARLDAALAFGLRLIQVRDKTLPPGERAAFAEAVVKKMRPYRAQGGRVLVNTDNVTDGLALAQQVGADGLHLSSAALAACTEKPPLALVAASCHDDHELAQAIALDLDFAVLGPVLPTQSHPGTPAMGYPGFAALVEGSPIPVFALGGMDHTTLLPAQAAGAHGVACLRGW